MSHSEYVYVVLTAITAGLSIFGGTCVCILYFAFKDLRSPGRQLLLYLAFSDALLAFGNFMGIIWYLYSDSAVINRSEAYCDFQSAMTIYFSMTSFSWTVTMATCLFATVVLNKQHFTVTYMKLFHVLAWIPGGLITVVALSMGVLGTDTTLEQASWCWIDPRTPNTLLWQFICGKFMEIVAYIATAALYAAIKIFLVRQGKKNIGKVSRKSKKDLIAEANKKLTFVPLVFIVCRIWGTLRFLIGNFGHDIVNEPYVTWINPLQGIGDSAQGFANFVIYCFSTQSIRKRMFPWLNKIIPLNDFDTTTAQTKPTKKTQVAPASCSYAVGGKEESLIIEPNHSFHHSQHEDHNSSQHWVTGKEIDERTSSIHTVVNDTIPEEVEKKGTQEENSADNGKPQHVMFVVPMDNVGLCNQTNAVQKVMEDQGNDNTVMFTIGSDETSG